MPVTNVSKPTLRNRVSVRLFGGASGGVFRGMATLVLGSGIGRVIGLASMPILTRLYAPEDFGLLAVFTALVAILAPLVTLRYVLALPLPRHDGTAMNLMVLSLALLAGSSGLIALLLWAFGPALLGEALAPWWWLVTLGILTTALYELLTFWATRKRAYKIIATTSIWQSATGSLVMIGLGLLAVKPGGLLIGRVVSQGGGIGSLLRGFWAAFQQNLRHIRFSRIRRVAWRYRGFPAWRVPSQFLMIFAQQAPLIFVAANFSVATTGQLSLALTGLTLSLNLLGGAAGKALYAEAARETRPAQITRMARQTQIRLLAIALIPAGILLFAGDYLFVFIFGTEWREAGQYAQILAPLLVFQFSSAPLMQLLNLVARQTIFLIVNICRIVLLAFCFGAVMHFDLGSVPFVYLYSATMCLFYMLASLVIFHTIGVGHSQPRGKRAG